MNPMSTAETSLDTTDGWPLIVVGGLLLLGIVAHVIGRRAHVPRVTLLLLIGVLAGPSGLGVVPAALREWFPLVARVALGIVGFLLGEHFLGRELRTTGRVVALLALAESLAAAGVVLGVLLACGTPAALALMLAGIAAASAPAATLDVVREIGGAVLLGGLLGMPMAWLTGRLRPGEPTLVEGLGFVVLCAGLAEAFGVSYLLSCITLGAVVANMARHHTVPFHAIEGVREPFLVVFFLLAGIEFDLASLESLGSIGVAYVLARSTGKMAGGYAGARLADAPPAVRKYAGLCLLPQAGVALGLALNAAERFPEHASALPSWIVGTTILFEILGPLAARFGLARAGETERALASRSSEPAGGS